MNVECLTAGASAAATVRNAVCLCADRNMLVPALFVADNVKRVSAHSAQRCDVIIFAEPSDFGDIERQWMEMRGIGLRDNVNMAPLRNAMQCQERLSAATLVRLILAEQLAGRYDKILYLDADVTIHDDIASIFALDTGEFAVAAVPAGRRWPSWLQEHQTRFSEHARALGMTEPYRYINTGVLLIDVAKWNRADLAARTLDFIERHSEICWLPDEHALNAVLDGRQADISPIWNLASSFWRNPFIRDAAEPVVIHYSGPDKPWKKYGYGKRMLHNRPAYRLYDAFLRNTPWAGWLDAQWAWRDLGKNLVYEFRLGSRRLRRRPNAQPTWRELRIDANSFRATCAGMSYADIDQGIVTREGGPMRLIKPQVTA